VGCLTSEIGIANAVRQRAANPRIFAPKLCNSASPTPRGRRSAGRRSGARRNTRAASLEQPSLTRLRTFTVDAKCSQARTVVNGQSPASAMPGVLRDFKCNRQSVAAAEGLRCDHPRGGASRAGSVTSRRHRRATQRRWRKPMHELKPIAEL